MAKGEDSLETIFDQLFSLKTIEREVSNTLDFLIFITMFC